MSRRKRRKNASEGADKWEDQYVASLQKQQGKEMAQQKSSLQNELAKDMHKATTALEEVASVKADLAEQNATPQEQLRKE
jgi:hypothetical protein